MNKTQVFLVLLISLLVSIGAANCVGQDMTSAYGWYKYMQCPEENIVRYNSRRIFAHA